MNQRIRLLALEAGEYVNSVYTPPVRSKTPGKIWEDGHIGWNEKFQEKFAELIVRECISCSTFIGITTHNSGLGPQPIRYTSMVNDKIRKHFGVEE